MDVWARKICSENQHSYMTCSAWPVLDKRRHAALRHQASHYPGTWAVAGPAASPNGDAERRPLHEWRYRLATRIHITNSPGNVKTDKIENGMHDLFHLCLNQLRPYGPFKLSDTLLSCHPPCIALPPHLTQKGCLWAWDYWGIHIHVFLAWLSPIINQLSLLGFRLW